MERKDLMYLFIVIVLIVAIGVMGDHINNLNNRNETVLRKNLDTVRAENEDIKKELGELQPKVDELKEEKEGAIEYSETLEKKLKYKSKKVTKLENKINQKEELLEEKRKIIIAQEKKYNNLKQAFGLRIGLFSQHPKEHKNAMIDIAENRIKYLHDKALPNYPLPQSVADNYAKWSYKYSREKDIPMFWMLGFAGYETNWVSDDDFDGGESWGPFSMQISTIRLVMRSMGYDIPEEPLVDRADLHQTKRFQNFVRKYKWKLFDEKLNATELFFEVAATYMSWKYEEFDNYVLATLAYNRGNHNYKTDTIMHHYPNLVIGEYVILETTLNNRLK